MNVGAKLRRVFEMLVSSLYATGTLSALGMLNSACASSSFFSNASTEPMEK
jgi:hypothetical protein